MERLLRAATNAPTDWAGLFCCGSSRSDILRPYYHDGQRLRCDALCAARRTGPLHADGIEHFRYVGGRLADRTNLRQSGLQSGVQRCACGIHCGMSCPIGCSQVNILGAGTNKITERLRLLQPHQAPPRRPHRVVTREPTTRLLRREDRQCGWVPEVVEGPACLQPQDREVPRWKGVVDDGTIHAITVVVKTGEARFSTLSSNSVRL